MFFFEILAWSLEFLFKGIYPTHDVKGREQLSSIFVQLLCLICCRFVLRDLGVKANLILRAVEVLSLNYWLYFRLLLALPSRCDFPFCNNILPKILAMQTEEVGNKQGGQGEAKNALQAGRQLAGGYCGVLWGFIGDLDYLVAILKLPNFNSSRPCSLCRCSLSGANSWNDFFT